MKAGACACAGVLVVDDNADLVRTLVDVLTDEGYRVSTAPNGREALELLRAADTLPCVILLDLTMPEMNGQQFRQEQLRDARLASVPVLGFSADSTKQDRLHAMQVDGIIPKPVSLDQLLSVVQRYCENSGG